jgi:hypothetical protein
MAVEHPDSRLGVVGKTTPTQIHVTDHQVVDTCRHGMEEPYNVRVMKSRTLRRGNQAVHCRGHFADS